jgi:hypothetical protein
MSKSAKKCKLMVWNKEFTIFLSNLFFKKETATADEVQAELSKYHTRESFVSALVAEQNTDVSHQFATMQGEINTLRQQATGQATTLKTLQAEILALKEGATDLPKGQTDAGKTTIETFNEKVKNASPTNKSKY